MVLEVKAVWTGWAGGPGYSTFHSSGSTATDAQNLANAVMAFFDTIGNVVPSSITISCQPTYRVMDTASGALITEGTLGEVPAAVVGTGTNAFAAVAGMCVNWLTNDSAGRKLRVGRTFLVPLTAFIWAPDGTVNDATVTEVQNAAADLASLPPGLVVWKRPRGGAGGVASTVVGARVPDEGVVLRSRRR